jgi:hypothetical protein
MLGLEARSGSEGVWDGAASGLATLDDEVAGDDTGRIVVHADSAMRTGTKLAAPDFRTGLLPDSGIGVEPNRSRRA